MREIEKMTLASEDLVGTRLIQLKKLMPEAFSEGGIDFEKLRLLLGDDVDEGQERYAFTWPGKADAIRQSQTVSTATLRPCPEKSRGRDGEDGSFDSDNIYIEGDNLEVLKLLQRGYHGKVKMIYIDPPYNTGHDFVYHDSFSDSVENYKQQAGLTSQSNADTSGRYHSDWCSMMYPRLKLARELLADDGAIFISIDDNEVKTLRAICDEIFGESCFVANIAWQKAYAPKNNSTGIPMEVEWVVVYSKMASWSPNRLPRTAEMNERYKSPDNDSTPWKSGDSSAPGAVSHQGMVYAIQHPITGELMYPPMSCCWRAAQEDLLQIMNEWAPYELRDLNDNDERARICGISSSEIRKGVKGIVLSCPLDEASIKARERYARGSWPLFFFTSGGTGRLAKKVYLNESNGRVATNYWPYKEVGHADGAKKALKELFNGAIPFDTPKPVELLLRAIELATDKKSIAVDFFSGSATLAEALMKKNAEDGGSRRSILVQLPEAQTGGYETLCDIGEERIRRAGDKIKTKLEESNRQLKLSEKPRSLPDIGFRVLALDESGIERPEPGQLVLDVVKPDRTELDIVFEMMLKWGLELTLPVEKSDAAGYPIWSVACDELVCCMSRGLTIDALEAIADMEPRRVLILDSVLDDTLKLNAVQIFKHAGERMGCEIELRTV